MATSDTISRPVLASGTFRFADVEVHRLGYGAMQLTGDGVWGEPKDRDECIRVLRRAVEQGVDFIDTADSYGPYVSEELIREALHPYTDGLIIATKAGLTRTGPGEWLSVGRPEYLRQECEMSLRRLGVERLDLWQLHRIDPKVPAEEQFGVMKELLDEGKVRSLGLSEVSVADIEAARKVIPVATVQNLYNLTNRQSEDVLDYCEKEQLGFIPWFPIASGKLAEQGGPVDHIVKETGASPSQVALAWLLARSPVMLPIPGTKTVAHVEENCAAATVTLSQEQVDSLTAAG
ncbi:aldo/keto reductase [Acidiferrimicrobium sp. IK]|uniref:aldo/keto reductase n=1 Tax=Acidiferrimicrobium sp. IK TaxID=2871700 RepID=UPI0021CB8DB8|nr:aldo/keto reductase [Acidiferrimicrobium sp. IK]MCU4187316.1 aldo/keto reductase [Acidiferrimicrobium sp. IK]